MKKYLFLTFLTVIVFGFIFIGCNTGTNTGNTTTVKEYNLLSQVSTKDNVISEIGREPDHYAWESTVYTKDTLPNSYYVMAYLQDNQYYLVFVIDNSSGFNKVNEMRIYNEKYYCLDNLTINTSLNDAISILGTPNSIVDGQPCEYKKDILYKNIDGTAGYDYYDNSNKNIRMFFYSDKAACVFIYGGSTKIKMK